MEFELEGPVVEWRGPAPFYFLQVSHEDSEDLKEAAKGVEYWGQVPVLVRLGDVEFRTALFPREGRYLVPLKVAVRRAVEVEPGQTVRLRLDVVRSA